MEIQDPFHEFIQEFVSWKTDTEALPIRQSRNVTSAFELDLDHLIDSLITVFGTASERSTQYDYPNVANAYLCDLNQTESELPSAGLVDSDRKTYASYISQSRRLIRHLGSLPVPPDGHLHFVQSSLRAFRFLVDQYGFEVVETSPIRVKFVSNTMFVELSYSPQCPMTSILVGVAADSDDALDGFMLDHFAYAAGLGVTFNYDEFDLYSQAGVAQFLQTAAFLMLHESRLMSGDPIELHKFRNKAEERERAYIALMEASLDPEREE